MPLAKEQLDELLRFQLSDGRWVFATSAEARILSLQSRNGVEGSPLLQPHFPSTTNFVQIKHLLNGVIGAYLPERFISSPATEEDYLVLLANNYVVVSGIEAILKRAVVNARRRYQQHLADFLTEVYNQERGHALLIERDFLNLGVTFAEVSARSDLTVANRLLGLLSEFSSGEVPQSILGIGYLLETNALTVGQDFIEGTVKRHPKVRSAMSFLRTHSAIGAEPEHVERLLQFVAAEPKASQWEITRGCESAAQLLAESAGQPTANWVEPEVFAR